jgi:predicted RecB family endonuclease
MDYEFRIKLLEQDTAHLREMWTLVRERQNINDVRLDKLQALSKETIESLAALQTMSRNNVEAIAALTANITTLAAKVDRIADTILGERRNGG